MKHDPPFSTSWLKAEVIHRELLFCKKDRNKALLQVTAKSVGKPRDSFIGTYLQLRSQHCSFVKKVSDHHVSRVRDEHKALHLPGVLYHPKKQFTEISITKFSQ